MRDIALCTYPVHYHGGSIIGACTVCIHTVCYASLSIYYGMFVIRPCVWRMLACIFTLLLAVRYSTTVLHVVFPKCSPDGHSSPSLPVDTTHSVKLNTHIPTYVHMCAIHSVYTTYCTIWHGIAALSFLFGG